MHVARINPTAYMKGADHFCTQRPLGRLPDQIPSDHFCRTRGIVTTMVIIFTPILGQNLSFFDARSSKEPDD